MSYHYHLTSISLFPRGMNFTLSDVKMLKLNNKWEVKQKRLYKKHQKEKASNIDF